MFRHIDFPYPLSTDLQAEELWRNQLERLSNQPLSATTGGPRTDHWYLSEDKTTASWSLGCAGCGPEDLKVTLKQKSFPGVVSVVGSSTRQGGWKIAVSATTQLPKGALPETVKATVKDGLLTLTVKLDPPRALDTEILVLQG